MRIYATQPPTGGSFAIQQIHSLPLNQKSYVFFFLNKKERGTSCLTQSFSTLSLLPLLQCF